MGFCLGGLKYVVCLSRGCDGCCVLCFNCEAWSCSCSCMGSVSVFVMPMLYVCVLCASCGSQCCILHDLQFVNAIEDARGDHYGGVILQNLSHDCLIGSHECLLLFTPSYCGEGFIIICRGLRAYTKMVCMCVLYVSFGSNIKPITYGCVAMSSAV